MSGYRRTGRTFRKILSALENASSGVSVVYINQNQNMCRWTFNKAMEVVTSYLELNSDITAKELKIKFVSGGSVEFMTWEMYRRKRIDLTRGKLAPLKTIEDTD